jgi:hypothetical protein
MTKEEAHAEEVCEIAMAFTVGILANSSYVDGGRAKIKTAFAFAKEFVEQKNEFLEKVKDKKDE